MRRFPFAVLLAAAGCIHGSPAPQRDSNALRAINQQERWAQDALARRPNRADHQVWAIGPRAVRALSPPVTGRGRDGGGYQLLTDRVL